jgi:hypothetical protein
MTKQFIQDTDTQFLRSWRQKRVLTLADLVQGLQASVRTVRRRLKAWQALASFNFNSRFYTLPQVPQFDSHGLWFYRDIGFSRHGRLPQTIVALVHQSPAGLTAAELGQRLRMDPRSFLWQFHQHPDLQRQKDQGHYVYFAADPQVAARQQTDRYAVQALTRLPSADEAIAILVQAIQHPEANPQELCHHLQALYPQLTPVTIEALFAQHGLTLKKTPPSLG